MPNDPRPYLGRALVLYKVGKFKEGGDERKKAEALDPNYIDLYLVTARLVLTTVV